MPTGAGPHEQQGGRRLSYWISLTLKSAREAAGVEEGDLARILGVSENTIKRIEKEQSFDRGSIDTYLAGYAYVLGIDDPRLFWEQAIDRWHREGAAPEFKPPDGPAAAFARAIQDQARRQSQSRGDTSKKPTSTQRRRATS